MSARSRSHRCPCGCGRQIPPRHLACKPGWLTLPHPMRTRITAAKRGSTEHTTAVWDALTWYREHRRDGQPL